MSASTWPGPTAGSWSMSPTTKSAARSGTALMSDCISMTCTGCLASVAPMGSHSKVWVIPFSWLLISGSQVRALVRTVFDRK